MTTYQVDDQFCENCKIKMEIDGFIIKEKDGVICLFIYLFICLRCDSRRDVFTNTLAFSKCEMDLESK